MKNPKGLSGPTGGRPKHLGPRMVKVSKPKLVAMTIKALREKKDVDILDKD